MHRAERILDSVVAILAAAGISAGKHRVLSYDPEMELPAVSVRMGPDAPPGESNIPVIDSELSIVIAAIESKDTEADTVSALMTLRSSVHVALMADRTLGLAFVSDTRYGGAAAPELETVGNKIAGRMEMSWTIPYRMNLASPE